MVRLILITALLALGACGGGAPPAPVEYSYEVVHTYAHDPQAFTQGLEYRDGVLYEGTGLHGRSSIRKVAIETGAVIEQTPVSDIYFGEGITIVDGHIVELTYKSGKGFVYDLASFRILKSFDYPGEGWGLTHDGTRIFMSDGTPQLRVWDPSSLEEKSRIDVHDKDQPVAQLNELEWVEGEIFANIWQTDRIARIAPADGHITGWIDLTGLLSADERAHADVLNGIAYDAAGKRLFVTGKLWPKLFEIKLAPKK